MFWAKSDAGGQPHSLIGHLLDTAAVAQLIWDEYCSPHFRHALNDAAEGRGRDLYVLCRCRVNTDPVAPSEF